MGRRRMTTEGSPTMTTPDPLTPEEEAEFRAELADLNGALGWPDHYGDRFARALATIDALRTPTPAEPCRHHTEQCQAHRPDCLTVPHCRSCGEGHDRPAEPGLRALGPMPDSSDLPPDIAAIRKRLVDRFDDLRWCNKDDECHTGAEWLSLAISDLDAEVRAVRAALATTPDTLDVERLARRIHEALTADDLLPDCSGTHTMGYATCIRLAARLREDRS